MKRAAVSGLALALVLSAPASAQIFGGRRQDEAIAALQREVAELRAQINGVPEAPPVVAGGPMTPAAPGIVQTLEVTRAEAAGTRTRVEDLEATLKNVNGTVEALTSDLTTARRELAAAQARNQALVERIAALESAQAAATLAGAAAARAADPATAWADARALLEAGKVAEAGAAFEAYASRHAEQPNAPEAHFLAAETLSQRRNYADAAQEYIAALEGWPKTEWAPEAVLKLSTALIELKEPAEACKSLAELDRRYASAPAALKTRARAARTRAKCA